MHGVFSNLRTALKKRRNYNTIISELNALNDRELNDLGINRSMTREIARRHAYGG